MCSLALENIEKDSMAFEMLTPQELDALVDTHPISTESSAAGLDSPFLRQLAAAGRDLLSEVMTEQHYQQGEFIFQEGEIGDAMYIIWSGRVAVIKGDIQSPIVLGYRGAGEIIGEMALLEGQPRSATIIALEDLRLLRIKREDFEQLLSSNSAVGMGILGTLSARLRAADDARDAGLRAEDRLTRQVSELEAEKQQLLELQQLRQETSDFIVHDLRHPISNLFGIIKLLEMVLPEEVLQANQELLNMANAACEHMQLLVDSLLDLDRLESGEAQLSLDAVDLPYLIEETIRRLTASIKKKKITVHSTVPDELPTVVADEEKVDRILANLVGNAIKYTPDEGQITIAAELVEEHVLVSVTDTGPGVPPEDRERIFERFAQTGENRTRRRGFGLGLAFCQLAVEAHGGRIWVEPRDDGLGSRFAFSLPLSIQLPQKTET
jgi:signal transduction histidine kinase